MVKNKLLKTKIGYFLVFFLAFFFVPSKISNIGKVFVCNQSVSFLTWNYEKNKANSCVAAHFRGLWHSFHCILVLDEILHFLLKFRPCKEHLKKIIGIVKILGATLLIHKLGALYKISKPKNNDILKLFLGHRRGRDGTILGRFTHMGNWVVKGGGGVKGQKYKLCLSYRVFSHEFNGFRFVKKFQVLFEISRRTRGINDHFRTQNWAKINVNPSK